MSFTIQLGTNTSDKNHLTKNVNYTQSLTGSLKNESDVVTPTILVEGLNNIGAINYMKIDEFGRVYFVEDIKIVRDNLFEIQARCDVLSSFASQIRANSGIIKKQANSFNTYLDDGTFRAYQNSVIQTIPIDNGAFSNKQFILAVAGG